jgi:Protein of unknown function (DUF3575)
MTNKPSFFIQKNDSMKAYKIGILFCLVGLFGNLKAQNPTSPDNSEPRMNVLKSNLLSPLSLGYERGIGKHFSLVVNGLYFPRFNFGEPTGDLGYVALDDPSVGFSAEARYYTSKTKAPLNGFYFGGYYLFRTADVQSHKVSTTINSRSDATFFIPSDLTSYGLMIGKQRIRLGGFTTDFNFGLGYYAIGSIPALANDSNETFKLMSKLVKYRSGIGPRLTFSLGYAF